MREIEKVRARAASVEERVRAEVREVRLGEMMDTGSNRQMSWGVICAFFTEIY